MYMHTYIIVCIVIVISHCSDLLSEAGFCQNYLDSLPVNDWPCSCQVTLGDPCLRECPVDFAHQFSTGLQCLLCSAFLCLTLEQLAAHYCACCLYQLLLLAFLKCWVCSCAQAFPHIPTWHKQHHPSWGIWSIGCPGPSFALWGK